MASLFSVASVSKDASFSTPQTETSLIVASGPKFFQTEQTQLRLFPSLRAPKLKLEASRVPMELTPELKADIQNSKTENSSKIFDTMKERFLTFKKHNFMHNVDHFQSLAKAQSPKFMVIACADSRVCPSNILGFQPGEAFTVRNVANIVPPYESGPSETKAALEFAVNSLEVENILVIGHTCCGGIRALMSMEEDDVQEADSSSFIRNWVTVGKNARVITKKMASNLSFDHQCRHCEKESVNCSLLNLFTYPWIEEKVKKGLVSIHGGYYDFVECMFEKWTVSYKQSNTDVENGRVVVKDGAIWH